MTLLDGLGTLHLAATLMMVGVIWFVQVVHYPLFAAVRSGFTAFEAEHVRRTGWVVAPLMCAEAASAAALVLVSGGATALAWIGLALVAAIWTVTFTVHVPLHRALSQAWDVATHRRLVRANWLRTVAWSARGVIAVGLIGG
jgi:hypothetical protein